MEKRRAKGLCFWCDNKFTPGHKYITKRLYFLCIVKDKEKDEEVEINTIKERNNLKIINPHISINALKGAPNYLKVTKRVDKLPIFIMINSSKTYNFMNIW